MSIRLDLTVKIPISVKTFLSTTIFEPPDMNSPDISVWENSQSLILRSNKCGNVKYLAAIISLT